MFFGNIILVIEAGYSSGMLLTLGFISLALYCHCDFGKKSVQFVVSKKSSNFT